MNHERVLTLLFDLALVIGGETRLAPLLTRTLQRFLHHTAFPAGLIALFDETATLRIAAAEGDQRLQEHIGGALRKPEKFCSGPACNISAPEFFAELPCAQEYYRHCLCLPLDHVGNVYLLAKEAPASDLALAQVFQPVLSNLAAAITLCRNNEAYLQSLETERRDAQNHLRESEARFQTLFANMHDGIALCELVFDASGAASDYRIADCNQRCAEILAMPRDRLAGMLGSALYATAPPPFLSRFATVVAQGEPFLGETYFEPADRHLGISVVPWIRNGFALVIEDITERHRMHERLEWAATYDALTRLPNRVLLEDRLHQALAHAERTGRLLAVCFLDLDGFKPINDTFGHEAGDAVLIAVAQRLRATLRAGDTVARLGGDEFVLLLSDIADSAECEQALQRLLQAIAAHYTIGDLEIDSISVSVGIALFPRHATEADSLLRLADQAMYVAKHQGKNRYHFFDAHRDQAALHQTTALARIKTGLAAGEFVLHYQPKVDMRHGTVAGCEALIRWQHPLRGLLAPAEFLPIVEPSPFASELGEWVIDRALAQMQAWGQTGLWLPVSVNIFPRHLQDRDFVERLRILLGRYPDVPPRMLQLELLETAALDDISHVSVLMRECLKLGVSFALDDFGTGYSSLTYLKRLPANVLKIDQSFIRDMLLDPEDLAIVDGVVGLSEAFRRTPVAEGVESARHGAVLLQLGCDLAQGYGIARPMAADAIPAWTNGFRQDPLWAEAANSSWSREDLPLLSAALEHRHWIDRLILSLSSPAGEVVEFDLPFSEHECHFGRWHDGPGRERYGHLPEFREIDPVHRAVHNLGRRMHALYHAGQPAEALALVEELFGLRHTLLGQIARLRQSLVARPPSMVADQHGAAA